MIPDGGHLTTLMKKVIEDLAWRDNACKSGPVFVNQKFTWEYVTKQLLNTFFEPNQEPAHRHQEWASVRQGKPENERDTMGNYDRRESGEQGGSVKSPDELYEEVQKMMNSGSKEEAIGALEMLSAMYPNYAVAHNDLGVLYFNRGEKEKTLEHYERAARIEPYNDTFQKNLADFYYVEAGRVEEALQIYVKLLEANPTDIETLIILGQICASLKKIEDAKVFYNKVLELEPWNMDARERLDDLTKGQKTEVGGQRTNGWMEKRGWMGGWTDGGGWRSEVRDQWSNGTGIESAEKMYQDAQELIKIGREKDAVDALEKLVASYPDHAGVYNNMGVVLQDLGRLEEAMSSFEMAVEIQPGYVEALNNMGNLLQQMGRVDEAVFCYQKVLELKPDLSAAHNNLGNAYLHRGELSEAISCYQKALELKPDNAQAYCNLGNGYQIEGRIDQAIFCYEKAVKLKPDNPDVYNNMGAALKHCGRLEEAVSCHRKALELEPGSAMAHNNLGNAYKHQGSLPEAISCYRKACYLKRDYAEAHSNLILAMQYDQTSGPKEIFYESLAWWKQHGSPNKREFVHNRPSDSTNRRLRIGYVSPDFREHSVSYFFLPLLEVHDRCEVEVFCYAEVKRTDKMTARIKALSDHWRSTVGLTSDEVARRIYEDKIDILVDLAGHTADNRLLVFARRPAPVQVTWLGYPDTTGMPVMDYRLTDEIADPDGDGDEYYSETLVRLTDGFLCYSPPDGAPDVSGLPSLETGHITFGSFNNLPKVNEKVIEVWSKILGRVPGSSLLLKSKQFADESTKRRYLNLFLQNGIAPERIRMLSRTESVLEHLRLYNRVDIGLDPFPYNGTTTTCEALWMGVPVVTLRGNRHSSRVGASILTRVGLRNLITVNEGEYISKAVGLASDLDKLKELRAGMRERMMESPLCDSRSFARSIEDVYRQIRTS